MWLKIEDEEFEQKVAKIAARALPAIQSVESDGKNFATDHADGH